MRRNAGRGELGAKGRGMLKIEWDNDLRELARRMFERLDGRG